MEWSGIEIYDGLGVGKCISYTQGGLTGKGFVLKPGNTMYQSYRDTKDSTLFHCG
jgi:hypothetical protein